MSSKEPERPPAGRPTLLPEIGSVRASLFGVRSSTREGDFSTGGRLRVLIPGVLSASGFGPCCWARWLVLRQARRYFRGRARLHRARVGARPARVKAGGGLTPGTPDFVRSARLASVLFATMVAREAQRQARAYPSTCRSRCDCAATRDERSAGTSGRRAFARPLPWLIRSSGLAKRGRESSDHKKTRPVARPGSVTESF